MNKVYAHSMQDDLISKHDVKWQIQEWINELNEAIDMLDSIPSAQPKMGKWVEVQKDEYKGFAIVNMRCNQCGRYAYLVLPNGTTCFYDYCPWCNADMKGEKE